MNIDINLDDVYDLIFINQAFTEFIFESPLYGSGVINIHVLIQSANNPFLKQFNNLAFGPKVDGQLNDFVSIKHKNSSKALSTVLFCGLAFLNLHPEEYLGIDGSDFRRAYFYYRMIQRNFHYLSDYFRIFGVKYYARVLRPRNKYDPMPVDVNELISFPYKIENQPLTNHKSLFNYYLCYLI